MKKTTAVAVIAAGLLFLGTGCYSRKATNANTNMTNSATVNTNTSVIANTNSVTVNTNTATENTNTATVNTNSASANTNTGAATNTNATAANTNTAASANTNTATSRSVTISGSAFSPATLTVTAGTTVTWTNNDSVSHTIADDDGIFTSGTLSRGQTYSHTYSDAGTFPYHCGIHPSMTGTVVVTE